MNKRAVAWTVISFVPIVGIIWWTYRVSKHIIEDDKHGKDTK